MFTLVGFINDEEVLRFQSSGSMNSLKDDALNKNSLLNKIEILEIGYTWVLKDNVWGLYDPDFKKFISCLG